MKYGFSLIELIVAVFMAAMVTLSLFQLLSQTRKAVTRINSVIDADLPFMAFCTQLEKDTTGMFAPQSSIGAFAAQEKKPEVPQEGAKRPKRSLKKKRRLNKYFI